MIAGMVSVIVPIYKVENYLRKCVDSILAQTYKNIEIILVDDGSPDQCGKICDEYEKSYDSIQVIHKQNEGLGFARNTGLQIASGEYIAFVDSDDYIGNHYLETMVSHMGEFVDVCKCGHTKVSDNGKVISVTQLTFEQFDSKTTKERFLPRIIGSLPQESDGIPMSVWGVLYKSHIIKDNNILFPSERELISEDLVFNIDYISKCNGACIVENTDYYYCMKGGSLSTSYRADRFDAICKFYYRITATLASLGYGDLEKLRLQRLFIGYVRMCIQQLTPTKSGYSRESIMKEINQICNNKLVSEIFTSYPKDCLPFPQKSFVTMVKYKMTHTLWFMCCSAGNNFVERVLKR